MTVHHDTFYECDLCEGTCNAAARTERMQGFNRAVEKVVLLERGKCKRHVCEDCLKSLARLFPVPDQMRDYMEGALRRSVQLLSCDGPQGIHRREIETLLAKLEAPADAKVATPSSDTRLDRGANLLRDLLREFRTISGATLLTAEVEIFLAEMKAPINAP